MLKQNYHESRGKFGSERKRKGKEGSGGDEATARILTSFAATLFDPFGVCDVIVTSFAVEKCSAGKTASMLS